MRWRLPLGAALAFAVLAACSEDAQVESPPGQESELLDRISRPGEGAGVHLVRLVQRGDVYAFDPAEIRVAPDDVVRFILVGSQPESVVFDPTAASPAAAAFIRDHSLNLGVLLTEQGQAHDVSFRDAPPGSYPFLSIPHASHGMRGTVVVDG